MKVIDTKLPSEKNGHISGVDRKSAAISGVDFLLVTVLKTIGLWNLIPYEKSGNIFIARYANVYWYPCACSTDVPSVPHLGPVGNGGHQY